MTLPSTNSEAGQQIPYTRYGTPMATRSPTFSCHVLEVAAPQFEIAGGQREGRGRRGGAGGAGAARFGEIWHDRPMWQPGRA
jgi:hypothetical protein